ncbi:hypothetical protein FKP32DRAFT_664778 [Trametes sanguinea]|nr:hypothetical protein FKP32DRAFT_664778 [Trametes sanguinea]
MSVLSRLGSSSQPYFEDGFGFHWLPPMRTVHSATLRSTHPSTVACYVTQGRQYTCWTSCSPSLSLSVDGVVSRASLASDSPHACLRRHALVYRPPFSPCFSPRLVQHLPIPAAYFMHEESPRHPYFVTCRERRTTRSYKDPRSPPISSG